MSSSRGRHYRRTQSKRVPQSATRHGGRSKLVTEEPTHPQREFITSWLDQIHHPLNDGILEAIQDEIDEPRETTTRWRPYNLPIAHIDAGNQETASRPRHGNLTRDRYTTKQRRSLDDVHERAQLNDVTPSVCYRKGRKRLQCSTDGSSHRSTSSGHVFKKRPRRKTRQDLYETKKRTQHREPVPDTRHSQAKKRKRHKLRSGRDIMVNFTSEAIPDKRLTLKPSLTTGLFLNGRSSDTHQLTDLAFNDMIFLSRREREKSETMDDAVLQQNLKGKTVKHLNQEDNFFSERSKHRRQSNQTIQTCQKPQVVFTTIHTSSSRGSTHQEEQAALDQARDDAAELEQRTRAEDSRVHLQRSSRETTYISWSSSEDMLPPHRVHPEPHDLDKEASDGATPECVKKALIDTGVFDHTGILECDAGHARASRQDKQDEEGKPVAEEILGQAAPSTPVYQDKGVMVSPWSKSTRTELRSRGVQKRHGENDGPKNTKGDMKGIGDSNRHQVSVDAPSKKSADSCFNAAYSTSNQLPIEETGSSDKQSEFIDQNKVPPLESQVTGRWSSMENVESLLDEEPFPHFFPRHHSNIERSASNFRNGHPSVQPVRYGTTEPQSNREEWECLPLPYQSNRGSLPMLEWSNQRTETGAPPAKPFQWPQLGFAAAHMGYTDLPEQVDNSVMVGKSEEPWQRPQCSELDETMQEFIKRIESEAQAESETIEYDQEYLDNEEEGKLRAAELDTSYMDFQRDGSSVYNFESRSRRGLSMSEYARPPSTMRFRGQESQIGGGVEQNLEMGSFWRPNRFM
ncbi:hypothetical protein G7046_g6150 [Stylonectria norvegica]|nr:hypothetical protein G7046_g6150 [Stylonectria norvegica]